VPSPWVTSPILGATEDCSGRWPRISLKCRRFRKRQRRGPSCRPGLPRWHLVRAEHGGGSITRITVYRQSGPIFGRPFHYPHAGAGAPYDQAVDMDEGFDLVDLARSAVADLAALALGTAYLIAFDSDVESLQRKGNARPWTERSGTSSATRSTTATAKE
jgi:hypothetical protein